MSKIRKEPRILTFSKSDVFGSVMNSMPNICDICNSLEPDDGFIFLSRDIRLAVRAGLNVFGMCPVRPSECTQNAFFQLIQNDSSDWKLCSDCANIIRAGIRSFWPMIRTRHREWLNQISIEIAAQAWLGYSKFGRGYVGLELQAFEDITDKFQYPLEYRTCSTSTEDNILRSCKEYNPTKEAIIVFIYLNSNDTVETCHRVRFQAPVSPPEAAEIRKNYFDALESDNPIED